MSPQRCREARPLGDVRGRYFKACANGYEGHQGFVDYYGGGSYSGYNKTLQEQQEILGSLTKKCCFYK